jgi:enterochelin esterase-like enzyme
LKNNYSAMKNLIKVAALILFFYSFYLPSSALAQLSIRQPLDSPRLQSLKRELESGKADAVGRFWQEVERAGTPLVEPIKGDNQNLLVTFLWRAKEENKYIAVFPMARLNTLRHLMGHLTGSDLWYKSYTMRRDARFIYLISANDSLTPFAADHPTEKGGWIAALQPDPLNPRRYAEPRDPESSEQEDYVGSIVELPGAPPQPFIRPHPDVPKGQVELIHYESRMLKNKRRLWVYTPPGYRSDGDPYRLLVLFDGWQYVQLTPTPTILDNMIADGALPPLVAVMVDPVDRFSELALNETFSDFMANELTPWIRQRYHVTEKPEQTVLGGLSLGGMAAAYTALRHPAVFGNVLSQSGSFQFKAEDETGVIRQFTHREKLSIRFYLEAGLLEAADSPSLLHSNRHLRDVLEAKGYVVHYSEYNGRHDHINWRGSLSQGLMALFGSPSRRTNH